MDSGFTFDQVIQKSKEIERYINNADQKIQQFEKNWDGFESDLRLLSRLSKEFQVEIQVLAGVVSTNPNDIEAFFTEANKKRLDELGVKFQEIIDLLRKISAQKGEYAREKVDYDSSIEFRKKLAAELNELRIRYFDGCTYNTGQSNLHDNSINRESNLGSDY